jgi:hypothetical protein
MPAKAKIRTGKKGGKYRLHTVKRGPNKGKRVKVYVGKSKKRKR